MTVLHLARAIDQTAFALTVMLPPGPIAEDLKAVPGSAVEVLPITSKWDVQAIGRMRAIIKRCSPDLIDCQGVRAGWFGRLAAIGLDEQTGTAGTGAGRTVCFAQNRSTERSFL